MSPSMLTQLRVLNMNVATIIDSIMKMRFTQTRAFSPSGKKKWYRIIFEVTKTTPLVKNIQNKTLNCDYLKVEIKNVTEPQMPCLQNKAMKS